MILPNSKLSVRLCFFLALIVSFSLFVVPLKKVIFAVEPPAVLGEGTALTEAQKTLLFAKPSVVQVTNVVTGEAILQATVATQLGAPALAGRTYPFKLSFQGSGFFVTSDGYLITNGHVAKPDEEFVAYFAIMQLTETIFKDAVGVLVETYYGYTPSDQELDAAYIAQLQEVYGGNVDNLFNDMFEGYRAGEFKISGIKYSNYIQTGVAFGSEKKVEELGRASKLIDSPYEGDYDSKDLALLKVGGSNFPTISLGSFEGVQIGTEVYALGYPGVAETLQGKLTASEAELEPSITKGIISAKKKLVDGTEAFQTDAAISHGNSGGPVLNIDGKVIGVATWGFGDIAGGESFNFMISVEEVERLLSRNSVTPLRSLTNDAWEKGLNLFSESHYIAALKEFETVKRLYPDNVDVDNYISQAQTAISQGKDVPVGPLGALFKYIFIFIGAGGVLIVLIVVMLLLRKRKKEPVKVVESVKSERGVNTS